MQSERCYNGPTFSPLEDYDSSTPKYCDNDNGNKKLLTP